MPSRLRLYLGGLAACSLLACASDPQPNGADLPGGKPVAAANTPADLAAFATLSARATAAEKLDAAGALAAYPARFAQASPLPAEAAFLDRIQASALALTDGEVAVLRKNRFVISTRREFPTFLKGLAAIYSEHLPLYVSADALLESVHSSYDQILAAVEEKALISELRALLVGMRGRLAGSGADAQAIADTDLYLSVALGLLDGKAPAPAATADAARISALIKQANAAEGKQEVSLFGVARDEDFSQFEPRGHYTDTESLQRYFRAQMWLGRVDLRLLETQPDGSQKFSRSQYLSMLLIAELAQPDLVRFTRIDEALRAFVGESDYMRLGEVDRLIADLGGVAGAKAASDEAVVAALVAGGYGKQQIASHLMVNGGMVKTLPLNRSFALLGQRYVVDSHVFSEVVYDRIEGRMMPSPLDAAFAALGNDQALAIHPELSKVKELPGALARMRVLVDAHEAQFWNANLYNLWLTSLRALSPVGDLAAPSQVLPEVARTDAWGRRLLSTQLGSWAELRHDTILYAKQSYTGSPACEFPDAYVDPYPAFYRALGAYAAAGNQVGEMLAEVAPELSTRVRSYFGVLTTTVQTLGDMAERELRGEPFTESQLAFVNQAVRVERKSEGCTSVDVPDGWYADLFFTRAKSVEFDPTIADVHTQPSDEGGNTVGRVLHVGTGYPRQLVATVDTCMGPRAYVGVVYAYHEEITKDFERLTDEEWEKRFYPSAQRPSDVPWLSDVLGPR
ncbi:MAG: DUF3160 domain-containing protein [Polyangiales bacterium]